MSSGTFHRYCPQCRKNVDITASDQFRRCPHCKKSLIIAPVETVISSVSSATGLPLTKRLKALAIVGLAGFSVFFAIFAISVCEAAVEALQPKGPS